MRFSLAVENAILQCRRAKSPARTLVSEDGEAVSMRAAARLGVKSAVIFIRPDGWSLGAPKDLEQAAFKLWEWEAFIRPGEKEAHPIAEWKP